MSYRSIVRCDRCGREHGFSQAFGSVPDGWGELLARNAPAARVVLREDPTAVTEGVGAVAQLCASCIDSLRAWWNAAEPRP